MLQKILLSLIILFSYSVYAQHSFIGAEACGMCHKTEKQGQQLSIWQNSKHAQAYQILLTEKADQVAKEKGFLTKAVETAECLKCHVSGNNVDATLLDKKFKIEDGVQCESCHGAGSDYKSIKIMKDREQSVANGMVHFESKQDYCIGCHNAESPTYVEFKFDEMWEKIKHPVPEAKE